MPAPWFATKVAEIRPDAEHVVIEPGPDALDRLERSGPFDVIGGYSLGSHLLLSEAARVSALGAEVALFAPVFGFAREEGLGGRVARAQVRYLARWLRTDPRAALADFYRRAGLADCDGPADGADLSVLEWGLTRLIESQAPAVLPRCWTARVGENDSLLEARELCARVAGVKLVRGATHHPSALLAAWTGEGVVA